MDRPDRPVTLPLEDLLTRVMAALSVALLVVVLLKGVVRDAVRAELDAARAELQNDDPEGD